MKVRVLRPALEDLAVGRRFYDRRSEGIGAYFFDSLFSEIDSLVLYAGIHSVHFGSCARLPARSRLDSEGAGRNGLTKESKPNAVRPIMNVVRCLEGRKGRLRLLASVGAERGYHQGHPACDCQPVG